MLSFLCPYELELFNSTHREYREKSLCPVDLLPSINDSSRYVTHKGTEGLPKLRKLAFSFTSLDRSEGICAAHPGGLFAVRGARVARPLAVP